MTSAARAARAALDELAALERSDAFEAAVEKRVAERLAEIEAERARGQPAEALRADHEAEDRIHRTVRFRPICEVAAVTSAIDRRVAEIEAKLALIAPLALSPELEALGRVLHDDELDALEQIYLGAVEADRELTVVERLRVDAITAAVAARGCSTS